MARSTLLSTLAVAAVLAVATGFQPPGEDADENVGPALLAAHNRERAKAELAPLTLNAKLTAAAAAHAQDMAKHQSMAHEGSDGSAPAERVKRFGYHYHATGENVAKGWKTVDTTMQGWMESPNHRANILGKFSEAGFARAYDDDGKPYWCAEFGLPFPKLDPARAAADLIAAVNKERVAAHLQPVTANRKLASLAAQFVEGLARADSLGETKDHGAKLMAGLEKIGYRFKTITETAGSGQPTAREAVATWIENPENRASLVGDFTEAGAGYALAPSGRPYWGLILAKPLPR